MVAICPVAEKNFHAPVRVACGHRGFCSRRLSFCNGKLITADPLHGQRKLARRIGQKGGDDLLLSKANQSYLSPAAQALGARPDNRSEALNPVPPAALTAPAYERQNQRPGQTWLRRKFAMAFAGKQAYLTGRSR
jgi:hypothetical protein